MKKKSFFKNLKMSCNFIFKIYTENNFLKELYKTHSTFHEGDSGIDLFIPENITIKAKETKLVDLEIVCICYDNLERNSYFIIPRSSIYKTPLLLRNSIGLVDANYNGTLKLPLLNLSDKDYVLEKNSRICQIILPNLKQPTFQMIEKSEISETTRGVNGFGSSG